MIGLLVSIRSLAEAKISLGSNARIIDIKEPDNGALGCVGETSLKDIANYLAANRGNYSSHPDKRIAISAALGEALALNQQTPVLSLDCLENVEFAKLGLAQLGNIRHWWKIWESKISLLPKHVRSVAVAYADHVSCNSPRPSDVANVGQQLGCSIVLLDTFCKRQGSVFHHMPEKATAKFIADCKKNGQQVVLAGSLSHDSLPTAVSCAPDFVGVRGAICVSDRASTVCENRLASIANQLANIQLKIST